MAGEIWQFAGSLLAVAVMIALAWRFGFAGRPVLADENEARAIARSLHGGFDAVDTVVEVSGHGALLRSADGRIAAVVPHGAHFVAWPVGRGTHVEVEEGELAIELPQGRARLELGETAARDWAGAINRLS